MQVLSEVDGYLSRAWKLGLVGIVTAFLSACTAPSSQPQRIVAVDGIPKLAALKCPNKPGEPRVCVDVIFVPFDISGQNVLCPVYTLSKGGLLNGLPDLSTSVKDQKLLWRAVDVAGNRLRNVTFYIYFDPFKGRTQSRDGRFVSGVLVSPPHDVQFKYTITADGGCPPFDPMIRISR